MTLWLLLLTFEALKFLLSFCAIHLTISGRQTFNFDTCLSNFIYTCHFCFIKWIIVFATLFYKNIITFLLFVKFLLLNCWSIATRQNFFFPKIAHTCHIPEQLNINIIPATFTQKRPFGNLGIGISASALA